MRYVLICLLLVGCNEEGTVVAPTSKVLSCRGVFTERKDGVLKKFIEYEQDGRCLLENMKLTHFDETVEAWTRKNVQCVPQANFPSRTVVAANNYYDYRNNRAFLDFNSATGIFRRIILAEDKEGKPVITKLQGCYYQRTGAGIDASFGKQLLLDSDINKTISTQYFDPMEIFTYTETATELRMQRFDDVTGYDYRNCIYLDTPQKFCQKLRDGNMMFFPVLPAGDQAALTNEAIILSKEFNWITSSKTAFDDKWNDASIAEAVKEDYKYNVIPIPDIPYYIDQSWRDYVMGNRPFMPNVGSSNTMNLCYRGSKSITLSDNSTGKIFGEICYVNGVYTFVQ